MRDSRKKVSLLIVTLVFMSIFYLGVTILPGNVRAKTLYVGGTGPGNYTTIQSAIDTANPGDTVFVFGGTYFENVTVYKTLSLVGEDKDLATIDANRTETVLRVTADWVNVTGFTLTNSMLAGFKAGIELHYADNIRIFNNNVSDNWEGIYLFRSNNSRIVNNTVSNNWNGGIFMWDASDNEIAHNTFLSNKENGILLWEASDNEIAHNTFLSNGGSGVFLGHSHINTMSNNSALENWNGIYLSSSNNNTIVNNTASNNVDGIYLSSSNNNTIVNNDASSNNRTGLSIWHSTRNALFKNAMVKDGIYVWGDSLEHWNTHVIDTSNIVNGKPVYYWKNVTGGTIPSGAGQVILANCTDVTVEYQNVTDGSGGIELGFSSMNILSNNDASFNKLDGISLRHSNNNTIANNTASSNNWYGIYLSYSHNNSIVNNDASETLELGPGIHLQYSDNNTILGNTALSNDWVGISSWGSSYSIIDNNDVSSNNDSGVFLTAFGSNNIISNNTIFDNQDGIYIWGDSNNTITNNTIMNSRTGIYLRVSSHNTLANNNMIEDGIYIQGNSLEHWVTHLIDTSNAVNGKPVYYWKNVTGGTIPSGAGQVILANCTDVTVEYQDVSNGTVGVLLGMSSLNEILRNTISSNNLAGIGVFFSNNNTFANNTVSMSTGSGMHVYASQGQTIVNNTLSDNRDGLYNWGDSDNLIVNNTISDNRDYGAYLFHSKKNRIYHNNIIYNGQQASDNTNTSQWDNGYPSGGNYWSDYTGIDNCSGPNQDVCPDADGIGDWSYNITVGLSKDRYPVMFPFGELPRPPVLWQAILSGEGMENVTVKWSLSPDDGKGFRSVNSYEIYRNMTYDSKGSNYQHVASLTNGTTEFTDNLAGEGDPNNYFYKVCALDLGNRTRCTANQVAKFTRPLSEGQNLVSIPLVQSDKNIETVFQTVKFEKAWSHDSSSRTWKSYMTFKPYKGDLETIDHTMGIWLNVTDECNLTVAGLVPQTTSIPLYAGWNLVSFPSFNSSYTVYDLKMDTGAVRVEGYDPAPPYHLRVLGDMEALQAGHAYWVRTEADVDWIVEVA